MRRLALRRIALPLDLAAALAVIVAGVWAPHGFAIRDQIVRNGPMCEIQYDGGGSVFRPNPYAACERVEIWGVCASQCTVDVFKVRDRVCVRPGAQLYFHTASAQVRYHPVIYFGPAMTPYPPDVGRWIASRGGLPTRSLLVMDWRQAASFLRRC